MTTKPPVRLVLTRLYTVAELELLEHQTGVVLVHYETRIRQGRFGASVALELEAAGLTVEEVR